ncbi:hypothetical protein GIB67_012348 [Kingdonia uniflora]|uniref:CCHC-type domain-containing protein n=1 Tax=Kingdonia uniflora TaxID=39325 RepID=A0A7J7MVH4_9MAGN|nr:hypothetical protein GIB67_012348 [Kingdonia uniflora]
MEMIVGSYDEGYFKMPSLVMQLLIVNRGSFVGCSRDDTTSQWTGTVVMFKASYDGCLRGCRLVLGLDGYFLKGKYGRVCLSLIGLDGNNAQFPVPIYLCRSECYHTWNTFLQALQPWLVQHDAKLTFISDRQKGLIKAVADNFHHCNHRFYFRHMYKNFKKIYRGTHLERLSWNAARAFRKVDKDNFLDKIGEDHLSSRGKPLHKALEKLNMMMMTLMYDRIIKASTWDQDGLVPRVVDHITKLKKLYGKFNLAGTDKNKWTATKDGQSVHTCLVKKTIMEEPPMEIRPPPFLRPTGRPRKARRKDEDELTNDSSRRCSKCGHHGHNKKTCKGPLAADKIVLYKKKLTRVDTQRSQNEIREKFGFFTPEITQTMERTRTSQQSVETPITGQATKINAKRTSNQSTERARQKSTNTRINSNQTNTRGTQSEQSTDPVRGTNPYMRTYNAPRPKWRV